MGSRVTKVVVDTSTLESVCKTDYDDPIFEQLPLCTPDVCFEELRRNRTSTDDRRRENAISRVFELYRTYDTPVRIPTPVSYTPYVEDQGEDAIIELLETARRTGELSHVNYVLLFDFDAAADIGTIVEGEGIEVNTPGRAFELVWQGGYLSEREYHRALRQLHNAEGWRAGALVDSLSRTNYDDVF